MQVGQAVLIGTADNVFPRRHGVLIHDDAVKFIQHGVQAKANTVKGQFTPHRLKHFEKETRTVFG